MAPIKETPESFVTTKSVPRATVIQDNNTPVEDVSVNQHHVHTATTLKSTTISEEPVPYVDAKTKAMDRKAELEELRRRNDFSQKKAAFIADSPMATSTLASFLLQQKEMKNQVRQSREGALNSLKQYRSKDCDAVVSASSNNHQFRTRYAGMPSAYSSMADIDDFFRKQKHVDTEWRKNKEIAFQRLHAYRQQHIHGGSRSYDDNENNLYHDGSTVDEKISGTSSGLGLEPSVSLETDDEVLNTLLFVHAELNQFFAATNNTNPDSKQASNIDTSETTSNTINMSAESTKSGALVGARTNEPVDEAEEKMVETMNEDERIGENEENQVDMTTRFDFENIRTSNSGDSPSGKELAMKLESLFLTKNTPPNSPALSSPATSLHTENAGLPCSQNKSLLRDEQKKDQQAGSSVKESPQVSFLSQVLDPFSGTRESPATSSEKIIGKDLENSRQKHRFIKANTENIMLNDEVAPPTEQVSIIMEDLSDIMRADSTVSSIGSAAWSDDDDNENASIGSDSITLPDEESVYSALLFCSHEEYLPNLHSTRGPCERCLALASDEERDKFLATGRHVRIMIVRGGCCRSCTAYPRNEDEAPVRLCRKCYFDTHRPRGRIGKGNLRSTGRK